MSEDPATYAFGAFEVDEGLFELRRGGERVPLRPKVFDVLLYLIRNRDRVVSKDELLERVWPGENVSESVLPTNVAALRRALGDERSDARMIQTVHGRGYRFVAPVSVRRGAEDGAPRARDGASDALEGTLFVGRDEIMGELDGLVGAMRRGRGSLVLLVGEPGIGKTRTADELGRRVRAAGCAVFEGRCFEGEGAPSFWPWVQILRDAVEPLDPDALREHLGSGAPDVAHLLPELHERLPEVGELHGLDSAQARFRLFDAVSRFLIDLSRTVPLAVVLDDLHWADEPTLRLMQFLAREIRDEHVLIVGAYRDVEVRRRQPLARILGELAQEVHFRRLTLRGFRESDVGRYLEAATGLKASPELRRAVFETTEGNPFFISETVRLLAAEGAMERSGPPDRLETGLPQGIRDVIGRRLDGLSPDCNELLAIASVIGRHFSLAVLERVSELAPERVIELLDEAETAHLVEVDAADGPSRIGRYAFSHALVRETLYEELSGLQRVRLHRLVAEALREVHDSRVQLSELANHLFQAVPAGPESVEQAIAACVRAAEHALGLLAYEEAVEHYEQALQASEFEVPADDERRAELLLALGRAQSRAGRRDEACHSFERAADLARGLGRSDLLARAAMGFGGWPLSAGRGPIIPNREFRALLEEALVAVGDGESPLRARLLAGLAVTPPDQDSMQVRESLSRRAVDMARRSDDTEALFDALFARLWALLGPDDTRERLEAASEILALAERVGDREKMFTGRENRVRSLLVLGEVEAADVEIEACAELARELRLPHYWYSTRRFQVTRALGDGRFVDAERLGDEMVQHGRRARDPGVEVVFATIRAWLMREQGRLGQIEGFFQAFVQQHAWLPRLPRAVVAYFYSVLGREEPARRHFAPLASHGFADVPRDENWILTLSLCAELSVFLSDVRSAESVSALLEPYAGQNVSHQTLRIYLGSAAHFLARLSSLLGRRETALEYFDRAEEMNARLGARPALARTRFERARLLLELPGGAEPAPADLARARGLLERVAAEAEELGMPDLRQAATALLEDAVGLEGKEPASR